MQVSAAEVLAAQRRAVLNRSPQTDEADTTTAAAPSAGASTAHGSDMPTADGGRTAQGSESATPSSDSQHAPAALMHRFPGEYPAPLYDPEALQLWLLQCCQTVRLAEHAGGVQASP